ncbi:MAG: UvrD-helicase domain-containing protein [Xanthomonadales bacterium]|nr:UvrD-helicase domain-containing protein [Xanthomonadales bacterium]
MKLNPQQQAAVEYLSGPLLVLAGAGSGKTRVITEKIAYLVSNMGLAPEKIAAITFTNKAAREMRERIGKRLKNHNIRGLTLCTFHALGWRILREHASVLDYRPGISILDERDTMQLVRDLLVPGTKADIVRQARWQLSRWKNMALDVIEAEEHASSPGEIAALSLYQRYQTQLKTLNAVDFDDLIMLPLQLLQREEIRTLWQEKLRYLLVDEYQDTNETQYRLLQLLSGSRGAFTAVGDDDQSIYAFRGAQPENINQLGIDYPRLKVIKLEQNYRSSGRVLKAANAVIANNPHTHEKKLWSALPEGELIRIIPCEDEQDEARKVTSEILHRKFTRNSQFGEFAVLYRGNFQSRVFEQALREQQVPYHLSGGISFFDRTEIKDLLCYFRLLINPTDNTAFLRVVNTPKRGLGAGTVAKVAETAAAMQCGLLDAARHSHCINRLGPRMAESLQDFTATILRLGAAGEHGDPMTAIEDLLTAINYSQWLQDQAETPKDAERRQKNVDDLLRWITRLAENGGPGMNLTNLIGQLSLMTSLNDDEDPGQVVRLMTLHAAKGLEFKHVFMVGVEEGLLPHKMSLDEGGEDEERRLMYVGITRAEETLTICHAKKRKRFGEVLKCKPSRFLDELPEECILRSGSGSEIEISEKQDRAKAHLANLEAMFGG